MYDPRRGHRPVRAHNYETVDLIEGERTVAKITAKLLILLTGPP